jgi:hypothetical protein
MRKKKKANVLIRPVGYQNPIIKTEIATRDMKPGDALTMKEHMNDLTKKQKENVASQLREIADNYRNDSNKLVIERDHLKQELSVAYQYVLEMRAYTENLCQVMTTAAAKIIEINRKYQIGRFSPQQQRQEPLPNP